MTTSIEIPPIPEIPESERTPLVVALHTICLLQQQRIEAQQEQIDLQQEQIVAQQERIELQQEQIVAQQERIELQQEQIHFLKEEVQGLKEEVQGLKDEIARLKGEKPKPKIRPSTLEKPKDGQDGPGADGKRPGSAKRSKLAELEIHETITISPPGDVPEGSVLRGHKTRTVQDLIIKPHNTKYMVEIWETPSGEVLMGEYPPAAQDGHFGWTLRSFILYQYNHAGVTQPLLLEMLHEFGVDISAGKVSQILTEDKDRFHEEKEEILRVGLEVSQHVNVDDTGARHKGKNGYCTHIGNELFAWFASTGSKSRVNFLGLLRGGHTDYVLSEDALGYMAQQKLPKSVLPLLQDHKGKVLSDEASWHAFLADLGITTARHIKIATEGALLGSALSHGLNPDLVVMSDDAGQFDILLHALCWIHAERTIKKLVGFHEEQRAALEAKREEIWDFYAALKAYKLSPTSSQKAEIEARFDAIFTEKTCFVTLNKALGRLHKNKAGLLLVLDLPEIPLHNNLSENDIREYVKKRKISGSTRSELGRRCRDTFASLKKTCRKLGVSFWSYLQDRVSGSDKIPRLPDLVRERATEAWTS